jgi:hypothetical protein
MQVLFNFLVGTFTGAIRAWVESSADVLFDMKEACQFFREVGRKAGVSV